MRKRCRNQLRPIRKRRLRQLRNIPLNIPQNCIHQIPRFRPHLQLRNLHRLVNRRIIRRSRHKQHLIHPQSQNILQHRLHLGNPDTRKLPDYKIQITQPPQNILNILTNLRTLSWFKLISQRIIKRFMFIKINQQIDTGRACSHGGHPFTRFKISEKPIKNRFFHKIQRYTFRAAFSNRKVSRFIAHHSHANLDFFLFSG